MASWNNWAETVSYDNLEEEYEPSNRDDLVRYVKKDASND